MKLKYFLWLHWLSPIGTCGNHNENEKTKQKKRSRNIYNVDVYLDHILLFCLFLYLCLFVGFCWYKYSDFGSLPHSNQFGNKSFSYFMTLSSFGVVSVWSSVIKIFWRSQYLVHSESESHRIAHHITTHIDQIISIHRRSIWIFYIIRG